LKSLIVPGGVLLLATAVVVHGGWPTLTLPGLTLAYYATLIAGLLLALRFHSSRVFFALVALLLSQQAITHDPGRFFNAALSRHSLEAVAFLLPLNFVWISLMRERGFTLSGIVPPGLVLFVQVVVVAVIGREMGSILPSRAHHVAPVLLPSYVWVAFATAAVVLLARFFLFRKPVESALCWSQSAFFLGLHFGGFDKAAMAYSVVSGLVLTVSIIETSYALAYYDELTALPSRRGFNEALVRLQAPYSIAVVDIDHFKRFNDTYGHDTGDQVLRLVASRLACTGGGGRAYRCGGEEFAILFPGKTTHEVVGDLEKLRAAIESSAFHVRGQDRRQMPRGPDRRSAGSRKRASTGRAIRRLAESKTPASLSVTVSIGVATAKNQQVADEVIQAADKALYRAKGAGRNRVETAGSPRRVRTKTAGIA